MINIDELTDNTILWQMSMAERASIFYLLNKIPQRNIAIEVGSYCGGFTRILSQYFDKVYSLDIDHSNIVGKDQYSNVTWVTGDSKKTLPELIKSLKESGEDVNFILIDGDHSYNAVLQDLNNALAYTPKSETALLVHDSWYEPSRDAINHANWNNNPHIHYIEKDFVPGDLNGNIFVGGLTLALMSKKKRKGNVEIKQTHDHMYRSVSGLLAGSR